MREPANKLIQVKMMPMQAMLVGAALLSFALVVHEASSEARSLSWWLAVMPWMAWIVSPYLPLFLLGLRHVNRARTAILYVLTVLAVGFAMVVYFDGFFRHLDAQSALLFIFVPLYQWFLIIVCGIVYLIVAVIRNAISRNRKKALPKGTELETEN